MGLIASLVPAAPAKLPPIGFKPVLNYTGKPAPFRLPTHVGGSTQLQGSRFTFQQPDYAKILGGDSLLTTGLAGLGVDLKGNLTGTGQAYALQSALTNARKAALESFGGVPDFSASQSAAAGFTPADIDATTRALAAANSNSTLAQLSRQYNTGQANSLAQIAAHGLTHSGLLAQAQNENLANFNTANYNAAQQLLSNLAGLQNTYQGNLQTIQTQRQQLVDQALQRLIGNINNDMYGTIPPSFKIPKNVAAPAHKSVKPMPTGYGNAAQRKRQAV